MKGGKDVKDVDVRLGCSHPGLPLESYLKPVEMPPHPRGAGEALHSRDEEEDAGESAGPPREEWGL